MKDSNFLKENNAKHLWHPMAHPADMRANAPQILAKGSGVRITDLDGHEVIDAVGGLWNVNLGYSCDAIKDAIHAQLNALPYSSIFRGTTNDVSIELSWMLREFFEPDGLARAFYTSGGSDGVEVALRLARQYHKLRGEEGRIKYFSLKKGYHGTHAGGASVNGNSPFRTQYEPLLAGCHQMPCPWTYRNPFNESDPEKLSQLCLQAIEDEVAFQNPATIAAFIMEPVLGAGGVIVPHASFMPGVREICHRNGILLIADEVITGYGRTGSWSGARHWGVRPDFAVTAKAITNGYFPFGAVMVSEHVADAFESDETGRAYIASGYTCSGHPVGAAAAIATLKETVKLNVKDNAAARGKQLFEALKSLKDKHAIIGDLRGGEGLMAALELVEDRETKTPIDPKAAKRVHDATYEDGVIVRVSGPNLLLSPPLVISESEIEAIISALDSGLGAA